MDDGIMRAFLTLSFLLLVFISWTQKKQPVLHTNVKEFRLKLPNDPPVTVRTWRIVPEVKPDVYELTDSYVKFITDVDSMTIKVSKKKPVFDFMIIYQQKDTCYTRVQFVEVPDYLGKLKKAKKYNVKDNREIPEFRYQDKHDPNLVALRQKYNLDSIAGDASDIHQMLNLMHWLHNRVEHDGQNGNPSSMNADHMIMACNDGSRGLNCRGLAITLNECFLAMGFKSRYVTCMPKELEFDDCHVINTVYSESLGKWVYLDPTFDAYVMDEKGTMLGIEEVRERLVNGKTLIVNPSANWNNEQICDKSYYLDQYMAKNLYRLECPVSSEYNYETKRDQGSASFIELLPLDGMNQTPQRTEFKSADVDFTFINYVTNNPQLFWKAPVFETQGK